ncbi:hypothetical protein LTR66_001184 [Elasticomyces elasticus]|nr:hypothetical protein LTR66_001184 [Elasticomyces elasticus]
MILRIASPLSVRQAGSVRLTILAIRALSTTAARKSKNRLYNKIRTENELNTLLLLSASSRIPLLTLWTANWCPSCKVISPVIRELIEDGVGEEEGSVGFAEVEIDAPTVGSLGITYMITSIPTLLAFDRQEPQLETKIARTEDLKNRRFLTEWIKTEARRHGEGGAGGRGPFGFLTGLFGR